MRYLGGKGGRLGREIVLEIERWRRPGAVFYDAFCGALNVVQHAKRPRVAADACEPLVVLLKAFLAGWWPPDVVTEEERARIKTNPDPKDPLTAFALFGCGYGGNWSSGYARDHVHQRNFAVDARNGLNRKLRGCDLEIHHRHYRETPALPPGSVLYCDPPYEGTTGYPGAPPFDPRDFWAWATERALAGDLVFVSEGEKANPPAGWLVLREWRKRAGLGRKDDLKLRLELLFVHESSPMARDERAHHRGRGGAFDEQTDRED